MTITDASIEQAEQFFESFHETNEPWLDPEARRYVSALDIDFSTAFELAELAATVNVLGAHEANLDDGRVIRACATSINEPDDAVAVVLFPDAAQRPIATITLEDLAIREDVIAGAITLMSKISAVRSVR